MAKRAPMPKLEKYTRNVPDSELAQDIEVRTIESEVTKRERNIKIYAGARVARAAVEVPLLESMPDRYGRMRRIAGEMARDKAVTKFTEEFGPIDWVYCIELVLHSRTHVIVEITDWRKS